MSKNYAPYPSQSFSKQTSEAVLPPISATVSGELSVGRKNVPVEPPRCAGKVKDVWLTVGASGKDDTNQLRFSGEVLINGVSCLSTVPSIGHVSGETSQQKTTKITGDTNITQAVIDTDNNSFNPGDSITVEFNINRTATPTTEINNPCIVVELDPDI